MEGRRKLGWQAALAGFLSVLLVAEPVAASVSEANVWKERRHVSSTSHPSFDVARLPAFTHPLAVNLPALVPAPVLANHSHASARSIRFAKATSLQDAVDALPWSLGRISKCSAGAATKTVVHIQDIHLNTEAQKNIGDAVAALLPWTRAVAIEGEWGPLQLKGFRSYARPALLSRVADAVFKAGDLDGPLHALLTTPSGVPLIGADSAVLYRRNVLAYREARRAEAAVKAGYEAEGHRLASEKARTYSPALRDLDAAMDSYHHDELPLGDYLIRLQALINFPSADVDGFLSAFRLERSIDLDRVASERRGLLGELARRLDEAALQKLVSHSEDFKAGELSAGEFYGFLQSLCAACGVDLHRYPAMSSYLAYVLAADRIDPSALQAAVLEMERRAVGSLVRTPAEARLVAASRRHRLTGQLIDFSLSPEEWAEYKRLGPSDPDLRPFEDFYRFAEARDEAMTNRLLNLLEKKNVSALVLVTGGFHANGVFDRLSQRGIRVIDWTPRITHVDTVGGSRALEIFSREKSPLQSLFDGRKLFLAPRPSRAFPRVAAALVALGFLFPIAGAARVSPVVEYNRLLPGAAATAVDVRPLSAGESLVTVTAAGGTASADVQDRGAAGVEITEARPAFSVTAGGAINAVLSQIPGVAERLSVCPLLNLWATVLVWRRRIATATARVQGDSSGSVFAGWSAELASGAGRDSRAIGAYNFKGIALSRVTKTADVFRPGRDITGPVAPELLAEVLVDVRRSPDFAGRDSLVALLSQLVGQGRVQYARNLPGNFRAQRLDDGTFRILVGEDFRLLFEKLKRPDRIRDPAKRTHIEFLAAKLLHETAEILMESHPSVAWERGQLDPEITNTEAVAYGVEADFLSTKPDFLERFRRVTRFSPPLLQFYEQATGQPMTPAPMRAFLGGLGYNPAAYEPARVQELGAFMDALVGVPLEYLERSPQERATIAVFGQSNDRPRTIYVGSGVFAAEDAEAFYVLTNKHLVEATTEGSMRVGLATWMASGLSDHAEQVPCAVVGVDPQLDLAVLRLPKASLPARVRLSTVVISPKDFDRLKLEAAPIVVRGLGIVRATPGAEKVFVERRRLSGKARLSPQGQELDLDEKVVPSYSGSPLFDLGGAFLGLIYKGVNPALMTDTGEPEMVGPLRGVAIPVSLIAGFLHRHGVSIPFAVAASADGRDADLNRSDLPPLEPDVQRFVAAVAHASQGRSRSGVTPERLNEAVQILLGDRPLTASLWEAAFDYLRFISDETAYQSFRTQFGAAVMAVAGETGPHYIDLSRASSVIRRAREAEAVRAIMNAAARHIDALEPRPAMPERLRADRVATFSASHEHIDTTEVPKYRGEDMGLRLVLPDGTILMFTGDGMGAYGHGDQAAQRAAAGFFLALLRFWTRHRGDEAALTNVSLVREAFHAGETAARAMIARDLRNTGAGVVFDAAFITPRHHGGWFFANYHRGDTRTAVGEIGKPLQEASVDSDLSGGTYTLAELHERVGTFTRPLLLRSLQSAEQLVHPGFVTQHDKRNLVSGGLTEGRPDDDAGTVTFGELPVGSFVVQSTDGRERLTDAAFGRSVAAASSLADLPRSLVDDAQTRPPADAAETFRNKPDDFWVSVAALGPVATLEQDPGNRSVVLDKVLRSMEEALDLFQQERLAESRSSVEDAERLLSTVSDERGSRAEASRALVAGVRQIVEQANPYLAVGEKLVHGPITLGFVVDDNHIFPGLAVLLRRPDDQGLASHERDDQSILFFVDRALLVAEVGHGIERDPPTDNYYAHRREIAEFRPLLEEANAAGISIPDRTTVGQLRADVVARYFPNGSDTTLLYRPYLVVDNGASADSPLRGMAVLYSIPDRTFELAAHDRMLRERDAMGTPTADPELFGHARARLAAAAAKADDPNDDVRRERLARYLDNRTLDEVGLELGELAQRRQLEKEAQEARLSTLKSGQIIVTSRRSYLVIDAGAEESPYDAGSTVLYDFDSNAHRPVVRVVDAEFYQRNPILDVREATPPVVGVALAARDHLRSLVKAGKSPIHDIDGYTWKEVLPADLPPPSAEASRPTAILNRTRARHPGASEEDLALRFAPKEELAHTLLDYVLFLMAMPLTLLSGGRVQVNYFLNQHDNANPLVRADRAWGMAFIRMASTVALVLSVAAFTLLDVLVLGGGLHRFGWAAVPIHVLLGAAVIVPAVAWAQVKSHRRYNRWALGRPHRPTLVGKSGETAEAIKESAAERAIDEAFPIQDLLGLGRFTLAKLPLLSLTDAQAANLSSQIRARPRERTPSVPWTAVQRGLVSRLAGDRLALARTQADRLAVAMEGGDARRRAADRGFVERLLLDAPGKRLVLFVDGSNPDDGAFYEGLTREHKGRIEILKSRTSLIRREDSARVLNLSALEAALAANRGAWDGAAFVVPSDLAVDTRGVARDGLLRRLVFLFLDETLRALPASVTDLDHLDALARVIGRQA